MSDPASTEGRHRLVVARIWRTYGELAEPYDGIPEGNGSPAFSRE